MKTKTVNLYTFDELSAAAKEVARQWWRDSEDELSTFADMAIEDAENVAAILGITFERESFRTYGGGTGSKPKVYWSLRVQGSGASFEGSYRASPDVAAKIRAEFPKDERLHSIADSLAALPATLAATTSVSGHYTHSRAMSADVSDTEGNEVSSTEENELTEALREFADWIYRSIDASYTYAYSDEAIDENIAANEYTFLESGKRED